MWTVVNCVTFHVLGEQLLSTRVNIPRKLHVNLTRDVDKDPGNNRGPRK